MFSILLHSPFVVRGSEFALADGGIDCSYTYHHGTSYARRLWNLHNRSLSPDTASRIAPFEVKSTTAGDAGDQVFVTSVAQRRRVAFWICVAAADPTFVDVIPNYYQEQDALDLDAPVTEEGTLLSVNITRISTLPSRTYGMLDQSGTPYRMPLSLLHVAIRRIRGCILGHGIYINPWNGVAFPDWKPMTTNTTRWLRSSESGMVFTSQDEVLKIYQAITFPALQNSLEVDFVGLQPRLGDSKFLYQQAGIPKQLIVQHKLDGRMRALTTPLTKVAIARKGEEGKLRHYFTAFERFDYLFYQFNLSRLPDPTRDDFFFIPERVLPDEFYTTFDNEASFERPEFRKYRFIMDDEGQWVKDIEKVVLENPTPRRASRPLRSMEEVAADVEEDEVEQELAERRNAKEKDAAKNAGSREYKEVTQHKHRLFWYSVMRECALRGHGLLVVAAGKAPYGDFLFCRYVWSMLEQSLFLEKGIPPAAAHHLPGDTSFTSIYYMTRYGEMTMHGPVISAAQFRRLNSCAFDRLVVLDIGGFDTMEQALIPAVIPSDDMQPSQSQRQNFHTLLGSKHGWKGLPNATHLLKTKLFASEYALGNSGPLSIAGGDWSAMWKLLDKFTGIEPFEHPKGFMRQPQQYRQDLRSLLQRLMQGHRHTMSQPLSTLDNGDSEEE